MKVPEELKVKLFEPEDLKVDPLDDYLLILVDPKHEKAGEIHLSPNQKQPTRVGTILKMGPKVPKDKVKIGDKVLMDAWNGHWLVLPKYKILGGTYKMVPEREIWGIIHE